MMPFLPAQNPLHAITNALGTEGPRFVFRGWLPAWLRLPPTTVLPFVFFEHLRAIVDKAREVVDWPSLICPGTRCCSLRVLLGYKVYNWYTEPISACSSHILIILKASPCWLAP